MRINPVVPHGRSDAFIPTGNEGCEDQNIINNQSNTRVENWVLSNEIRAEDQNNTRGKEHALTIDDVKKSLKATVEELARHQRSRKQLANSLDISVSSLEKIRKELDITFSWSNKKAKHSTPSTSSTSTSSAASVASVSPAVASSLAATLSSALEPLLAATLSSALEPLLATSLKNLSSSLDQGHEFKSLGIYDKHDLKATEIQDLDLDDDSILARVNFQPPGFSWVVSRFKIRKNTTFNELIGILNKKLVPVPQNMKIYYEDTFGMFGRLADEEDMTECFRLCRGQKLVNLVIDHQYDT